MSRSYSIEKKLNDELSPQYLLVENESHKHNVPSGSETHYKITLISTNLVQRHQIVYTILKQELEQGLHALSLNLYTPEEWEDKNYIIPKSPPCHNAPH